MLISCTLPAPSSTPSSSTTTRTTGSSQGRDTTRGRYGQPRPLVYTSPTSPAPPERQRAWCPSPTLSPTDPVPRGLLTLCPAPTDPVGQSWYCVGRVVVVRGNPTAAAPPRRWRHIAATSHSLAPIAVATFDYFFIYYISAYLLTQSCTETQIQTLREGKREGKREGGREGGTETEIKGRQKRQGGALLLPAVLLPRARAISLFPPSPHALSRGAAWQS